MKELEFNIYAFARPTTQAEYSALLDEAVRMAEGLEQMVDGFTAMLEANAACKASS